jgi:hypothetical protein
MKSLSPANSGRLAGLFRRGGGVVFSALYGGQHQ